MIYRIMYDIQYTKCDTHSIQCPTEPASLFSLSLEASLLPVAGESPVRSKSPTPAGQGRRREFLGSSLGRNTSCVLSPAHRSEKCLLKPQLGLLGLPVFGFRGLGFRV